MTRFRPCIDLHAGRVKQIVGGTLRDSGPGPQTNFESDLPAAWFANRYRMDQLQGGHVIQLGPGNDTAAREALAAFPGGLQIGGGINGANAMDWLEAGASHIIVTSWLFSPSGHFLPERLEELVGIAGRDRLVIDLSCRRDHEGGWTVCMNRWQSLTSMAVTPATLAELSQSCAEFLVHAADVEGRCAGMDHDLLQFLGTHCPIPVTYAGGARSMDDLELADRLSGGKVDITVGSALDLFGGHGVRYADCVAWNHRNPSASIP